ncbi:MAG TPA: thiamine phosphate synthase [Marinospirillum sp.]|uniref:thiamine phosphate synthase n=1 Tax=Marinospirillum sp. TaxID=2183934 RepID=UPI002B484781|nr:thiamine phosphate synthase [Marinospirillum sp.]HKM14682.1 thiamine phosphate synthase [Marinospirillum sp.]
MLNQQYLRGIYAITDANLLPDDTRLQEAAEAALRGGIRLLQYRDKTADASKALRQTRMLADLCLSYECQLIINDDPKLAKACEAAGVHLGQNDANLRHARQFLGQHAIIGSTCHNSLQLAIIAAEQSANYLAFGRFFSSTTKPYAPAANLSIFKLAEHLGLPTVAIGGISLEQAPIFAKAGASMIAAAAGVFAQPCPEEAVRALRKAFESTFPFQPYEVIYDTLSRPI